MKYKVVIYKIKRFFKLGKVALHKPYMLKAVLTTRCPQCGRWFSFPKIVEQNTRYHDNYDNYFCGCKICEDTNDAYWDAMWDDYYSKLL